MQKKKKMIDEIFYFILSAVGLVGFFFFNVVILSQTCIWVKVKDNVFYF